MGQHNALGHNVPGRNLSERNGSGHNGSGRETFVHNDFWETLPPTVRALVLQTTFGQEQLFALADAALSWQGGTPEQQQSCALLGQQAMHAAWEYRILDQSSAHLLLLLHTAQPFLPTAAAAWAATVSASPTEASLTPLCQKLTEQSPQAQLNFAADWRKREPTNLFVIQYGFELALRCGDMDRATAWVQSSQSLPLPVRMGLLGDVFLLQEKWHTARDAYAASLQGIPNLLWKERWGQAALRSGDCEGCCQAWREIINERPWHTGLLLRLDDVLHGRTSQNEILSATTAQIPSATTTDLPHGKGCILIQTYNNISILEKTLPTVLQTERGETPVIVLDNGSTDATPLLLNALAENNKNFQYIRLDAHIGIPAGRNWLYNLPPVRTAEWLTMLHDDVLVPPQWLGMLAAALRDYPNAPLVGCRVTQGSVLCAADAHIQPPPQAQAPEQIRHAQAQEAAAHAQDTDPLIDVFGSAVLTQPPPQTMDFGQTAFLRPCAAVDGGCLYIHGSARDSVGNYDLRLASAYACDADFALRLCQQGRWPVYQGHLSVRRLNVVASKNDGKAVSPNTAAHTAENDASMHASARDATTSLAAAAQGGFKLRGKYGPAACAVLAQHEADMLMADLQQRHIDVHAGTERQ